jgi:hypothetical protein
MMSFVMVSPSVVEESVVVVTPTSWMGVHHVRMVLDQDIIEGTGKPNEETTTEAITKSLQIFTSIK